MSRILHIPKRRFPNCKLPKMWCKGIWATQKPNGLHFHKIVIELEKHLQQ